MNPIEASLQGKNFFEKNKSPNPHKVRGESILLLAAPKRECRHTTKNRKTKEHEKDFHCGLDEQVFVRVTYDTRVRVT